MIPMVNRQFYTTTTQRHDYRSFNVHPCDRQKPILIAQGDPYMVNGEFANNLKYKDGVKKRYVPHPFIENLYEDYHEFKNRIPERNIVLFERYFQNAKDIDFQYIDKELRRLLQKTEYLDKYCGDDELVSKGTIRRAVARKGLKTPDGWKFPYTTMGSSYRNPTDIEKVGKLPRAKAIDPDAEPDKLLEVFRTIFRTGVSEYQRKICEEIERYIELVKIKRKQGPIDQYTKESELPI